MFKMFKVISLLVAFALLITMAAGCGKKADTGETEQAATTAAATESVQATEANPDGLPITDKPLELTMWKQNNQKSEYSGEMDIWKRVAERTNISIKFVTVPFGDSKDLERALALEVAAGAKYDIYQSGNDTLNPHAQDGAFIEISDLVNQYAPTIKKYLVDIKENAAMNTANNGKMYVVSQMSAIRAKTGYFIRKDWMDKLSIKSPETPEDWVAMLTAFRDKDPNGNGQKDEIPFFTRTKLQGLFCFASTFGVDIYNESAFDIVDNKVVYNPIQPQFKDYLAFLNTLYKQKLIDQEYLTRANTFRDDAMKNNIGGSTFDWFGSTGSKADQYAKEVAGMEFTVVAPPSITGKTKPYTRVQMEPVRNPAFAISKNNKYPVESIKLLEYIFSDEGTILFNFGLEGKHYNVVDGKYVYTDAFKQLASNIQESLQALGSGNMGYRQHVDYENANASAKVSSEGRSLYENGIIQPAFPYLKMSEQEATKFAELKTDVETYRDEMMNKFIIGSEPLDKFDEYVKTLKEKGIDEMLGIYQPAYERYLQN